MKEQVVSPKQFKKEVSAISDGTVIDHIDSKSTFKVANILSVQNETQMVLVGMNLSSKHLGKKGIIKIGGRILTQSEVNKIALIAPDATLNIIKDYEVVRKFNVAIPDIIESIVKCFNPNCVSNHEKIQTKFHTISKTPLKLRCHYCERTMKAEDIELV
ncbi:MAG TPA: aspartate carbamoyltransferase regulatory subunit [Candidatus Brocadiia bacterium]|nr:aspartate carbamoyltransferase regulatory subunit [Planctomycetota bacterium]MBI4006873.1 aspartate carbamoyltransferase regulatory subunit [Planctomycetota bacterium]